MNMRQATLLFAFIAVVGVASATHPAALNALEQQAQAVASAARNHAARTSAAIQTGIQAAEQAGRTILNANTQAASILYNGERASDQYLADSVKQLAADIIEAVDICNANNQNNAQGIDDAVNQAAAAISQAIGSSCRQIQCTTNAYASAIRTTTTNTAIRVNNALNQAIKQMVPELLSTVQNLKSGLEGSTMDVIKMIADGASRAAADVMATSTDIAAAMSGSATAASMASIRDAKDSQASMLNAAINVAGQSAAAVHGLAKGLIGRP